MIDKILEHYSNDDIPFLRANGFDDAIIGVDENSHRVVYDADKCVRILINRDGMDYLEALEYFDYNVRGSYMGEKTPIFCDILEKE